MLSSSAGLRPLLRRRLASMAVATAASPAGQPTSSSLHSMLRARRLFSTTTTTTTSSSSNNSGGGAAALPPQPHVSSHEASGPRAHQLQAQQQQQQPKRQQRREEKRRRQQAQAAAATAALNAALAAYLEAGDARSALRALREAIPLSPHTPVSQPRPDPRLVHALVLRLCGAEADPGAAADALLLLASTAGGSNKKAAGAGRASGSSGERMQRRRGRGAGSVLRIERGGALAPPSSAPAAPAPVDVKGDGSVAIVSFSHAVEHCLRKGLVGKALALFDAAERGGVALDVPACNHLLASLPAPGMVAAQEEAGEQGQDETPVARAVDRVLEHMWAHGLAPTATTYACAVWAAVRGGDFLKATQLLQAIDDAQLPLPMELWLGIYAATLRALNAPGPSSSKQADSKEQEEELDSDETAGAEAAAARAHWAEMDRALVQDLHAQAAVQLEAAMAGALAKLEAARRAGMVAAASDPRAAAAAAAAAAEAAGWAEEEGFLEGEEEEDMEEWEEEDEEASASSSSLGRGLAFPPVDFLASFHHHHPSARRDGGAAAGGRFYSAATSSFAEAEWEDDEDEDLEDEEGFDAGEEYVDDGPLGGDGDLVLTAEDGCDEEGEEDDEMDGDPWELAVADQAAMRRAMHPTVANLPTELLLWTPSSSATKAAASPLPTLPWGPLPARVWGLAGVAPQAFVGPFELLDELVGDEEEDEGPEGFEEEVEDGVEKDGKGTGAFFLEAGGLLPADAGAAPFPDLTTAAGATRRAQKAGAFGPMRFASRFFFPPTPTAAADGVGEGAFPMLLPSGQESGARTVQALMGDLLSLLDHRRASGAARGEEDDDGEGEGDGRRKK